jgi:hypothetical protein
VTTAAYPDLVLPGSVSYIDPRISAQTRTAGLRVEVQNPRNLLRLGMYADVQVSGVGGAAVPMVPRTAVQTVGDRQVVYLADSKQPGTFIEREVRLGPRSGGQIEVLSGVQAGDSVVTEGSFFVRAERERLGLRAPAPSRPGAEQSHDRRPNGENVQTARIEVGEKSFEPATVTLRAGTTARITVVRTTDNTCATDIVFPSLNVKRALPLNQPVVIEFTPARTGEIAFACGMSMLRGTVVVE